MRVTAEKVCKSYRLGRVEVPVLKDVNLDVESGESVAIVGASGAGKSTLLNILGGLDRPDSGQVTLGDNVLLSMTEGRLSALRAESIGFIFQSYQLLPEMDVLENVMIGGMPNASIFISSSVLRKRAADLLGSVGLSDRVDHMPLELSGGEQQRVALARALMNEPDLVLADEPTGNLDDATGDQVLSHLFSVTKERGHTLIIVTHNDRMAKLCGRILKLTDGGLV